LANAAWLFFWQRILTNFVFHVFDLIHKELKKITLMLCVFTATNLFGQAVTYYPFTSLLSFASDPTKGAFADIRFQMNSPSNSLSTEIAGNLGFSRRVYTSMYWGGGVKFNYLNSYADLDILEGYFMNIGFRATPFERKLKNAQIVLELSPFAGKNLNYGNFRANFGIGYVFRKTTKD
jgi:hypothetical protein